jgi:hypothetical protein
MPAPDQPPARGAVAGLTILTAMLLGLAVCGGLGALVGATGLGLIVGAFVGLAGGTAAVIVRFRDL